MTTHELAKMLMSAPNVLIITEQHENVCGIQIAKNSDGPKFATLQTFPLEHENHVVEGALFEDVTSFDDYHS